MVVYGVNPIGTRSTNGGRPLLNTTDPQQWTFHSLGGQEVRKNASILTEFGPPHVLHLSEDAKPEPNDAVEYGVIL